MQPALLCLLALIGSTSAQFSASAQTAIVKAHNDLRSSIAKGNYVADGTEEPPASNMLKIKWDATVAASAQKYANLCPDDHSGYPGLGENLYWSWTSATISSLDSYGVSASNSWQKEFQDYGWTSTTLDQDTFDTGIGHATQMAWAKTGLVGCGVKNCGKDASMNNMNKVTVVCQYKAQGNVLDDDIYQPGDTCSFCPSGTKCESASGLCV
uniref:SCP domain-containing protein n=1 Tax=Caenorhabditis japonica TaxID=281687 RepID=A0A8R1E1B2_CAEJA